MSRFEEGRSLMPTFLIDGANRPRIGLFRDVVWVWMVGLLLVESGAGQSRAQELSAPRITPGPSRPAFPALDNLVPPNGEPLAQGERPGDLDRNAPFQIDSSSLTSDQIKALEDQLLPNARAIATPLSRARALERVGELLTYVGRYDEAHDALIEAGQAALRVEEQRERNLRLERVIRNLMALTAELLREAVPDLAPIAISEDEEAADSNRLKTVEMFL